MERYRVIIGVKPASYTNNFNEALTYLLDSKIEDEKCIIEAYYKGYGWREVDMHGNLITPIDGYKVRCRDIWTDFETYQEAENWAVKAQMTDPTTQILYFNGNRWISI